MRTRPLMMQPSSNTASTAARLALAGGLLYLSACGSRTTPYQGMSAEQIYAQAQADVADEDWGDAADALDRLLLSFPEFSQADEASLMLADAFYQDEKYILAAGQYARFVQRYPRHPETARASLRNCLAYAELAPIAQRDQDPTRQALGSCRNVAANFFGTPEADSAASIAGAMIERLAKAQFEQSEHYFRIGAYISAILYYEDVVEFYPETEWAPKSLMRIIESNEKLEFFDEVELAREQLITSYPLSDEAAIVRQQLNAGGMPTDTASASGRAAGRGAAGSRSVPSG